MAIQRQGIEGATSPQPRFRYQRTRVGTETTLQYLLCSNRIIVLLSRLQQLPINQ